MRQRYAYSIIFPQKKGRKLFPGGKMETGRQQNGNGCRPVFFSDGREFPLLNNGFQSPSVPLRFGWKRQSGIRLRYRYR